MTPRRCAQALACAVVLSVGLVPALRAQYGNFGQNKIQYRRFNWRVLHGEHVDLYYYPEEEDLGRVALTYAEESYDSLSRRFNHAVTKRFPMIVYASHNAFEQTNVLPFIPPEGLLGVTEFLRRRVALPFRGNYAEFRHTIRHELVHVFQLSMVSQTFGRHPRFRQVGMPLWWTEGMAEFFSAGEDSRDEMVLRDMTIDGHLPSLPDLYYASGGLVYPVGAASIASWPSATENGGFSTCTLRSGSTNLSTRRWRAYTAAPLGNCPRSGCTGCVSTIIRPSSPSRRSRSRHAS